MLESWFDDREGGREESGADGGEAGILAALRRERFLFDPRDSGDLAELRADVERIAAGMDDPDSPPPMIWSGIPLPDPAADVTCGYHLVISIGGTKTELALLRLEHGTLIGFDLASGREVATADAIARLKDASKMATPIFGKVTPTGNDMVRQICVHMATCLRPHLDLVRSRCEGALLSWGFANRVVRTSERLLGGVRGIVASMTKAQAGFQKDLAGRDIAELFQGGLEDALGWAPPIAIANDTVMALFYFLGPRWRGRVRDAGLFINGTGTNFACAEPYAVRPQGFISAPGEEYQPERIRPGRPLRPGETAVPFLVNYESGSIDIVATRTRFDTESEYPIEHNALAGGNAFPQQLEGLTVEYLGEETYRRLLAAAGGRRPGGPLVGALSAARGSGTALAEEISGLLGGISVGAGEAAGLRLIARAIVHRSALHAALVLAAVTLRTSFGRGGGGKPDLLGMEGSVWKIDGYPALVEGWWRALAGPTPLEIVLAHEPSYNASLPGPLYLAALSR